MCYQKYPGLVKPRLYLMVLQRLKKKKESATAVVTTRSKSKKTIDGVRKWSNGKRGTQTVAGGADIFSEENTFAGVIFGRK